VKYRARAPLEESSGLRKNSSSAPVQAVYMGESLSHLFGGPKETVETE
jgi:hypothetical protein